MAFGCPFTRRLPCRLSYTGRGTRCMVAQPEADVRICAPMQLEAACDCLSGVCRGLLTKAIGRGLEANSGSLVLAGVVTCLPEKYLWASVRVTATRGAW